MFNLKKARVKPTEKMLIDQNDSFSHHPEDTAVITDKQLDKSEKKYPDGDKIGEKQLDSDRDTVDNVIAEKQLNTYKGMIPTRRDDGIPLMDMYKEYGKEASEKFSKENKPNDVSATDTDFWDYYVDTGKPKIVNNVQPSQLLSNYSTRNEMNKENPSFKKAMSELENLKDADAMLYHVYRKAASENRELYDKEKQMVNDINSAKLRIIAWRENPDDWKSDQSDIMNDKLEKCDHSIFSKTLERTGDHLYRCPICGEENIYFGDGVGIGETQ